MALGARVAGGTGAGSKRPLKPAASWECSCPEDRPIGDHGILFGRRSHPSWRTRCEDCGTSKP